MKKLLLFTAIAVFGFTNVNAQTDADGNNGNSNDAFTGGYNQGDWTVTGSLNYNSTTQDENKENGFGLMAEAGYFFTENWQAGLNLGYMSFKEEQNGTDTDDNNSLMAGGFLKYYCSPQNRFSPHAGLMINYNSINYNSTEEGIDDYKESGFGASVGVGADFFLNDDWALTTYVGALSYSSQKGDWDGAEAVNSFGLNLDFKNIWFGVKRRF